MVLLLSDCCLAFNWRIAERMFLRLHHGQLLLLLLMKKLLRQICTAKAVAVGLQMVGGRVFLRLLGVLLANIFVLIDCTAADHFLALIALSCGL